MTIFNLFINFINNIMNFSILGIKISVYLLSITIIIIVFKIIKHIAE